MTKKTHISLGLAFTLPLLTSNTVSAFGVLGLIGSVAPDWDFKLHIPHRTFTHCLLILFLSTYLIFQFNIDIAITWFINIFVHLFMDSLTRRGIPLFYPFIKKRYGLKLFKTGGAFDFMFFLMGIYLIYLQLA